MNIIKIEDKEISGSVIKTVNARDLHAFLEVGKDFSSWIKQQIERGFFDENKDYILLTQKGEQSQHGGHNKIEYHLALEMAKHVGMMSGSKKGKDVRDYFIECEKKALNDRPVMTQAEIVLANAQRLVDIEREQKLLISEVESIKSNLDKVNAKQTAFEEGFSYFTILAYASYKGITVDLTAAKDLGKRATALSKEQGVPIDRVKDPRFGYVNSYHESILDSMICELL